MIEQVDTPNIDKIRSMVVCPVELALRILGGKWRGSILYQLKDDSLRFNDLKYRVQDAVVYYDDSENLLSNKVLSAHLNELIGYDLIYKSTVDEVIYYQLTERGKSVIPILLDLFDWGDRHF